MVIVVFNENDSDTAAARGLWQYDYGQVLRIQGLELPGVVEIHFSLNESGGEAITRIGVTKDGATDVTIPDTMLENNEGICDYSIYAFIYPADEESGETTKRIKLYVKSRPKPEAYTKETPDIFAEVIAKINEDIEEIKALGKLAESYAVGGTETREDEDKDNAKYYAKEALDALVSITGRVVAAKSEIDNYVSGKEAELKGDTGDVYFTCFRVMDGRLYMYTNSEEIIEFYRIGSRLYSRIAV